MRASRGFLAAAAASLLVIAGFPATAMAGAGPSLTEIPSAAFPERSYVLSVPRERALSADEVRVTENGREVHGLTVEPSDAADARDIGLVLAIDASNSMRGDAIDAAMTAARAFADRRLPEQPLGVVFFGGDVKSALEPTVDDHRIDSVLAAPPPLSHGTRLFDATKASVDLLEKADISAGTVVVLSDGADVNSRTSAAALAATLDRSSTRVYTVGLRSSSYDDSSLRSIAESGGGDYAVASSSRQLEAIFDQLGRRLAGQYVVTYQSLSPLGTGVDVRAELKGGTGVATTAYRSPDPAQGRGAVDRNGDFWSSPYAPVALSLIVSAVVGLLTFTLTRSGGRSARARIGRFVLPPETRGERSDRRVRTQSGALLGAQRTLKRSRIWSGFQEQVELARIELEAGKLALWTLASTVAGAYALAALTGRPVLGALAVGLPVAVLILLRVRVSRERRAFGDQLAENLQVLASAMRAGHSFLGALTVMTKDAGEPARREFQRVITDEHLGVPIQDALATVARRMRNPDVEYVGLVAQLQTETGGNTAEVLDRVTDTIRERNALHRLVRTLTAQGRLGGWVVSLLPVGLIVALNVINPDYLDPLLESGRGKALFLVGIGCIVAGMVTIRKIVDIKV